MSNYLNTPLSKRLEAFRRNNCQSLGGGWHTRVCDENKRWHWVPHGFSTTADFGAPFKFGSLNCRWGENIYGHFRKTGEAHEILRLRYKGWFMDHFQDHTTRGIVLQLPGRKRKTLYLAACSDPWNEKSAIIEMYLYHDKEDAARAADGLAESYAEDAREADLKHLAETEIASLKDSIKETKEHIRSLVAGIRQSSVASIVCDQLRNDIRALRKKVRQKLARIEKIKAEPSVLIPY